MCLLSIPARISALFIQTDPGFTLSGNLNDYTLFLCVYLIPVQDTLTRITLYCQYKLIRPQSFIF